MKMKIQISLFILFFAVKSTFSQSGMQSIQQREELKKIRNQIEQYEKEITEKKSVEANAVELISDLDREITVTKSFIKNLRTDINKRERQVSQRQKEINEINEKIARLREQAKKRIVAFYKHGKRQQFELLLASDSFSQVKTWLKYQKLISQNDQRLYQSLIESVDQLQRGKQYLQAEIYEKERNISERHKEETQLRQSKQKRNELLTKVRSDTRMLEKHLNELRESQRQVKNFISQNEEKRLTRQARKIEPTREQAPIFKRDGTFASLKGKLPWPAKGHITSKFGRHKHPIYKTVTENLGIEIQAPLGTPVVSVDQGQVQTITWQRGLGNIVIISHDDGYYTVYAHLDEIQVSPMQQVTQGEVIGTVGDTGSMSGPILQFQIWKNTDSMNPEDWIG